MSILATLVNYYFYDACVYHLGTLYYKTISVVYLAGQGRQTSRKGKQGLGTENTP